MPPNQDEKLVRGFFERFVFGDMKTNIDVAINGKANFLAALGLVAWSEFLGALELGTIEDKGGNSAKFNAFLRYLGAPYEKLDKELRSKGYSGGFYEAVRNGLVHQFFVKEPTELARSANKTTEGGIFRYGDEKLVLIANRYLQDFIAAAAAVMNAIIARPQPKTLDFMRRYLRVVEPGPSSLGPTFTSVNVTTSGTFKG